MKSISSKSAAEDILDLPLNTRISAGLGLPATITQLNAQENLDLGQATIATTNTGTSIVHQFTASEAATADITIQYFALVYDNQAILAIQQVSDVALTGQTVQAQFNLEVSYDV